MLPRRFVDRLLHAGKILVEVRLARFRGVVKP
jgi:hypothetical protein